MVGKPEWLDLTELLIEEIFPVAKNILEKMQSSNFHISQIPLLSLLHLYDCISVNISVNREGKYSVAICLVRQCVEALTLIDVGLQENSFREPIFEKWCAGKKSHGEIRRELEESIWPKYGSGLWEEPWAEFFSNLAKAVQPYAHYSDHLMGWQMAVLGHDGGTKLVVALGVDDPVKASRITLLNSLVVWTLGRLLTENCRKKEVDRIKPLIDKIGVSLAASNLLSKNQEWAEELLPHVIFKAGYNWQDG